MEDWPTRASYHMLYYENPFQGQLGVMVLLEAQERAPSEDGV